MAKIKLGARPKNFTAPVKFQMLDGTDAVIDVTFKYRTRTEFGAFLDEIYAENNVAKHDANEDKSSLLERAYQTGVERHADQIMRAAEGWSLDEAFNAENVQALCDEFPAAALAIMSVYQHAINEGRLGN